MTLSETPSPPAKKTFPLGALLTSAVALTTLVGLTLHLMGHSSRTSYLEALGIPAELFFQTPEQHIILGYHILVGAFFAFLEGGMDADNPSRQRGLDPGAAQGEPPRVLPVVDDSRFMGSGLSRLDRKMLVFLRLM